LRAIVGTLLAAPLFVGFVILYVPYQITGWRLAPPFFGWEPTRWIGVTLIALAALVLADFVARYVLEGHGTPMPMDPPRKLVVRGVFRWVRNPAYIAAEAALVGQGLIFASTSVLMYAVVMGVLYHLLVVLYEEPTLRRTFGAEYEAYCREVPRWIPRAPGPGR
jgi:protein-S-isoprenylcysteine O-methyltransferase Ste14